MAAMITRDGRNGLNNVLTSVTAPDADADHVLRRPGLVQTPLANFVVTRLAIEIYRMVHGYFGGSKNAKKPLPPRHD